MKKTTAWSVLILAAILSFSASSAAHVPWTEPEGPESSDMEEGEDSEPAAEEAGEPGSTEPEPEPGRLLAIFQRLITTPEHHAWNVSLGTGGQFRETAYGDRELTLYLRLHLDRRLTSRFNASVVLDHVQYGDSAANLKIINTQTMLGLGVAYVPWLGPFNFDIRTEVGTLIRTSDITDGAAFDHFDTVLTPAAGLSAGLGIAFLGRTTFTMRGGLRYHPGRLDFITLTSLEFYFGAMPE